MVGIRRCVAKMIDGIVERNDVIMGEGQLYILRSSFSIPYNVVLTNDTSKGLSPAHD
jgi:hypothetical protein